MNHRWNLVSIIVFSICLLVLSGCGAGDTQVSGKVVQKVSDHDDEQIMTEFKALIDKNSSSAEIIRYMKEHITNVNKENASKMVIALEQKQKEQLKVLETRFFEENGIQEKLQQHAKADPNFQNIDAVTDTELKQLLTDVREGGYKIEIAEGMYFPVIDYEAYQLFIPNVTKDIAAYIMIMAQESKQVPVKDAALRISWAEVVNRSLQQEKFLVEYPNSVKASEVNELHKRYLQFTFLGSNNTPLFNYDTKLIDPEAMKAYTEAVNNKKSKKSKYLTNLSKFLDLVNKSNGKLTDEVDQFRKSVITG